MLFPALADPVSDRTALSFPDRSLSYVELARAARACAGELDGVARVAVLAEPRIETAVAVIAALVAGVPVIPINPKSGSSELAHIVGDADPEAIAVAPGSEVPAAFAGPPRGGDRPRRGGRLREREMARASSPASPTRTRQ